MFHRTQPTVREVICRMLSRDVGRPDENGRLGSPHRCDALREHAKQITPPTLPERER